MRRRLSNPIAAYAVDTTRAAVDGWNAFWYTPADPTLLGLIRVLAGLMLVYTHAVWGLALEDFFGPRSWLSPDLVRAIQDGSAACSFWWWIPPALLWPVHLACLAVLGLFTVGLWTRATAILSLVIATSYAHRTPEALFGLDQINILLTLYLAVGPSGSALSVDRWLARRRGEAPARPAPSVGANLALRLMNVHMCIIYLFAGLSKLQGPSWWSGEAMWRALANQEYQSVDLTWLAWYPMLTQLATHLSVAWEVSFAYLVWRPRLRPLMLAGAVALHLGIGAFLGMWTFGLVMLIGCCSFLPPSAVGRWLAPRDRRPDASAPRRRPARVEEMEPEPEPAGVA